ncbi:MAG: DUF1015 domain-containing protein [Parasporobacterium sp.]|nr:DUF1015 domain-containing protein [Parasporobacterium sp.]
MANVKPFRAIRPRRTYCREVATLPYDVFTEKQAREAVAANPRSFLKIVRPETMFPEGTDMYGDEVYLKARDELDADIRSNFLKQDETECYYIYRQVMQGRSQTGIVACYSVDDYLNNVIKKHEFTRHDKETDRTKHIDICNAQTGMVFLAFQKQYNPEELIGQITKRAPLYDFISRDEVRQIVWKVDDPQEIEGLTRAFDRMESLYIADGHHRCASAAAVALKRRKEHPDYNGTEEFNYFMAVAFPHDQLVICPYNRVMKDLNGLTDEQFLAALPEHGFDVERVPQEFTEEEKQRGANTVRGKGEFAVYLSGCWYRLKAHPEILKKDPVGTLESSLLQDNILEPILGVKDIRADKRMDFVGGIKGFEEIERRCKEDMKIGFALYPTSLEELFRVTDAGLVMPPKSTWFEPKLQSGLFIHRI